MKALSFSVFLITCALCNVLPLRSNQAQAKQLKLNNSKIPLHRTKNVLTVGGATVDTFINYKDPATIEIHTGNGIESFLLLKEGAKVNTKSFFQATGGGATNSAFSFKRFGFSVATLFKLGSDQAAKNILNELQQAEIESKFVVTSPTQSTGQSFIIPSLSGDRTVFACRGANVSLVEKEIPYNYIEENIDCLYITSLSGESEDILLPLVTAAKKDGALVALNPGSCQLKSPKGLIQKALPFTDILIMNKDEAKTFMNALTTSQEDVLQVFSDSVSFNVRDFFTLIHEKGPRIIVVTNGAEGSFVSSNKTIYFHPCFPVKVVNTLGAGDAFGSTFVASILAESSIEDAIRYAVVNSASVTQATDAKTKLLTFDVLQEKVEALDKDLLKLYS